MKAELVDNTKTKKQYHRKMKCKCGKEMTDSAFEYHKLRCEVHKNAGQNPYPVQKMSSEEAERILLAKNNRVVTNGKWMKKLVYKCKIGEVLKISVPDHREAQRICQLWKYYVKARNLVATVKISKTWKGKDVFLSMSKE